MRVLNELDEWKFTGGQYRACCPAHDDDHPSLAIREADDGRVLLYCHAGCETEDILEALDLTFADLRGDSGNEQGDVGRTAIRRHAGFKGRPVNMARGRIVATYDYQAADGTPLYQKIRQEPKTFRYRRPLPDGSWEWKLGDVERVLYRLSEVIEAIKNGDPIYLVEGEKDADRAASLGYVATCNCEGASVWLPAYSDALKGAHVRLIVDDDEPGFNHGKAIYEDLHGKAASIQVYRAAVNHKGADLSDHLDAGYSINDLVPVDLDAPEQADTWDSVDEPSGQVRHRGQLRFAERFTDTYGGQFLYVHGIDWHEYDCVRWAKCDDGAHMRAAIGLVKQALRQLGALTERDRDELYADIKRVESANGISGVLELAGYMHPCAAAMTSMDANPLLLNTQSGTVDLESGAVREPDPNDRMTKVTRAAFNRHARSAEFEKFLADIQPKQENRDFLARLLGSALLGVVREHVLPIWIGTGANGKGTLRDAVLNALGDYAIEVPADLLIMGKYGGSNLAPERMRLRGVRLAFCSEIAQYAKLDEAAMKTLTGGDPVNAKLLYRNPVQFDPSHTLVMLTNHLPQVRGDDPAIWRRVLAVPFTEVIPEGKRDVRLPEKLKAEPDAVLAWLWSGWLDYIQRNRLEPPDDVLTASRKYREDSDLLARFLADESAVRHQGSVPSAQLYQAFTTWCRAEGEEWNGSNRSFTEEMTKRGYRRIRANSGQIWQGIKLVAQDGSDDRYR